jgi:Restriction endonuclease
VRKVWFDLRGDEGTATRDVTQIRHFFEDGDNTLWITFYGGLLWWCFAKPGVRQRKDGKGTYRQTASGWKNTDIHGVKLSTEKLSGNLLKVQGFQGTICEVKAFEYLKRKLNGEVLPEVEDAAEAENQMVRKIVPLMRLLTWHDFELLVDLVFANSGWRRVGQVGKTQKTVDIELVLPSTGERAFVQVKSSAGKRDLKEYLERFKDTGVYDRMFFVWHSGDVGENEESNVVLIGPDRLARMVFDAGLTSWLREKVS